MVPAMMVNARQTASLTGLKLWPSLLVAGLLVYLTTRLDYQSILTIMSGAGLLMVGLIVYIAASLQKSDTDRKKEQLSLRRGTMIEKPENIA